jgi:hypothetical protein
MNLIINSEEPGTPVEHLWSQEELDDGWRAFEAAQVIWRAEKGYDPRVLTTKGTKSAEEPRNTLNTRNGSERARPTVAA